MRNRLTLALVAMLALLSVFGVGHAWVMGDATPSPNEAEVRVVDWDFGYDTDFALIDNVSSPTFLTATREVAITRGSNEAVRLTNTAGKQGKNHTVTLSTDRDYTLSEIRFMKVSFDYYYAEKREQAGKGLPKIQLLCDNVSKGSDQGGGDNATEKSPFICDDVGDGWWHLEYFITALCPTMTDHGDKPLPLSQKINGIKITDSFIFDYASNVAFSVIDNLRFSAGPTSRLGLFNRTTNVSVGGYYWFKVAWSGELRSCVITFSDPTLAEHDTASTSSPFYIKGLKAGKVTATATVETEHGTTLSISNQVTVS